VVTGQLHTFKIHYKATHLGADLHPNYIQELPAVYSNQDYNHFVYYGGDAPWTNAPVTTTLFPNLPHFSPVLYVPEHWGAYADARNQGITLYAPSRYPYAFGFASADPGPGGPTDNAKYSNGTHTLNARVSDRSGNIAVLPTFVITVSK
jgi:hypothetical protein